MKAKFEEIKSTLIPRLDVSKKCTKLCHFGKTKFPGTNELANIYITK